MQTYAIWGGVQTINDIKGIADIEKLPVLTKEMIREHGKELLTIPSWQVIKAHTSGTTGMPLTVYESWPSIWSEQAYVASYRRRCGFFYGKDKLASLRGHLDRKDKMMYVSASKTLYLSTFLLNETNIKSYCNALNSLKPKAIEGYPSALINLCLLISEEHLECSVPIIFTSSESLGDSQRTVIEETLHGRIFDHYGTTERTISLNENINHSGYYEDPGYSINEYYEGYVLTTSLINNAFPLIRYKVEDGVEKDSDGKITGINGRTMVQVTGKDGTRFSSAALNYLVKAIPDIVVAQLVQKEVGKLDVNLLPKKNIDNTTIKIAKEAIDKRIGKGNMDVNIRIIDKSQLIYTKRGKLELIVNMTQKH